MLQKLINLSDVYLSNTYIMTEWVLQWLITNCLCSLQQKEGCCLLWKLERVMSTLQDCFKNERAQHVSMSGTEQVLRVHGYYLNKYIKQMISSVQFSSQSCRTIYNPIDGRTPGLPVHQQLPQFTQTHIHWVGDVIQPAHPLPSPSPPASSLSQHQGLLQRVSSSHQVAKVLEFQLQHQSFQWIFRTDFL